MNWSKTNTFPMFLPQDEKQYRVDHVDFITKALERRVAMETERITAALGELDTNQSGKICLQVR